VRGHAPRRQANEVVLLLDAGARPGRRHWFRFSPEFCRACGMQMQRRSSNSCLEKRL
jgi:hypothetical protein